MGNHDVRDAPHNTYRCRGEDAWVAVAVGTDLQWQGLCAALERPDWSADAGLAAPEGRKAREAELDGVLAAWCGGRERWEATRLLQAHGVPSYPCMSSRDLTEDPHLAAREFMARLPHPEVGERIHAGVPWRMTHRPNGVPAPAPLLGQHTDEVLRGLLGCPDAEIAALRESGAIE
jgi:benzylsuccinate CoA-transferase BbsF subunit